MKRSALCALLAALLAAPAVAVGPLAMLAREMVNGIVRQFVENRMNQMLATAGPCGMPIAQPGAMAGLAGMLRGRGGMPAMCRRSLAAYTGLPGTASGLAGAAGSAPMGPPATMRGRADTSTMVGASPEQIAAIEAGAMPSLTDMKLPAWPRKCRNTWPGRPREILPDQARLAERRIQPTWPGPWQRCRIARRSPRPRPMNSARCWNAWPLQCPPPPPSARPAR